MHTSLSVQEWLIWGLFVTQGDSMPRHMCRTAECMAVLASGLDTPNGGCKSLGVCSVSFLQPEQVEQQ